MRIPLVLCMPWLAFALLWAPALEAKEETPVAAAVTAAHWGRILNLSGRQRMLTQRMSKQMLLIALEVERPIYLERLKRTAALFDRTLHGLRDGDVEAGLPRTTAKPILEQIKRIEARWKTFRALVDGVRESGRVTSAELSRIATENLPLLRECNLCVELYEREAQKLGLSAHPEIATVINLAGRQRMLTQKMSKEFFLLALGHEVERNRTRILGTAALFGRTLRGLKDGDEEQGLPLVLDLGIKAQLLEVGKLWRDFAPHMKRAARPGATIAAEEQAAVAKKNVPLLDAMDKAVSMFEPVASPNRK